MIYLGCELGYAWKLTNANMNRNSPPMPTSRCAPGIQEYSLCGWAYDAYASGDADAPVVFAQAGEEVTCQECLAVIRYIRSAFRRGRYLGVDV